MDGSNALYRRTVVCEAYNGFRGRVRDVMKKKKAKFKTFRNFTGGRVAFNAHAFRTRKRLRAVWPS